MEGYFDDDVELLTFSSLFPLDLLRACTTHHAAILCEGSTLKSTFANALTLFMCEAAGVMSGQGKPCIAYGSEVGEMEPFLARAAARLCKDTYFITRTQNSLAALKKLHLRGSLPSLWMRGWTASCRSWDWTRTSCCRVARGVCNIDSPLRFRPRVWKRPRYKIRYRWLYRGTIGNSTPWDSSSGSTCNPHRVEMSETRARNGLRWTWDELAAEGVAVWRQGKA